MASVRWALDITAAGSRQEGGESVYVERFALAVGAALEGDSAWSLSVKRSTPWFEARVLVEAPSSDDAEQRVMATLDAAVGHACSVAGGDFAYNFGASEPELLAAS